jgi:hypothetical protein
MQRWQLKFKAWMVPLALLAVCGLAYGVLLSTLGFYWDDWSPMLINRVYEPATFWKFFGFDRPTSAWTYYVFAPVLGTRPLNWHLFTFFLRWGTCLAFWWLLGGIWPEARFKNAAAVLLFAVYPVFSQQAIAVTYHQLWLEFCLFFISFAASVFAVRKPKFALAFSLLGLLALGGNLSISEYFLGSELLRPLFLWLAVRREDKPKKTILRVLLAWLPYLGLLAVFVIWRLFFAKMTGGDPNKPYILYELLKSPLFAIRELLQYGLQDTARTLVSSWYKTFDPLLFDLHKTFLLGVWAVSGIGAVLSGLFLHRLESSDNEAKSTVPHWEWLLIGGAGLIMGPMPAWITGRIMSTDPFSDRYAAVAMFGAALFMVGLLDWFAAQRWQKALLMAVLIGLAIGGQMRDANEYRWQWTEQKRFYWQMYWRAPYLQPQTAVYALNDIFPVQGRFATSITMNLVYPQPKNPDYLNYWAFSLTPRRDEINDLIKGRKLDDDFRIFKFVGKSRDGVVIHWDPKNANCLWVLGPQDKSIAELPDLVREALPLSNLNRIESSPKPETLPLSEIFGAENQKDWCYFYEKASLARQQNDWEGAAKFGDEARKNGYSPNNSQSDTVFEWYPVLEAYAHLGRWADAIQLTREMKQIKKLVSVKPEAALCQYWKKINKDLGATQAVNDTYTILKQELGCVP